MTDEPLTIDQVHNLLAARQRRYLLYCLYLFANPIRLPDVAGQVSEWEYNRPENELLDERLDVYLSLYHNHVPRLSDAAVIAYSQSEDMVELGQNAAQLRPHLERAAERDLETTDFGAL